MLSGNVAFCGQRIPLSNDIIGLKNPSRPKTIQSFVPQPLEYSRKMALFAVREKKTKKKLYAAFSKSIGVYAVSDARGQYLT
jgi:hypothetical protein